MCCTLCLRPVLPYERTRLKCYQSVDRPFAHEYIYKRNEYRGCQQHSETLCTYSHCS